MATAKKSTAKKSAPKKAPALYESASAKQKSGKRASVADFKYGEAYYVEQAGNPEGRETVQPTFNLAADAAKFARHASRGEAYLGAKTTAKAPEFNKVKLEAVTEKTTQKVASPRAATPVNTNKG